YVRVFYARSPHDVVALGREDLAALSEVHSKLTLDQHHERGSLLARRPLVAPLAGLVRGPLDLDILAVPYAFGRVDEMAEKPTAVVLCVLGGVPMRPIHGH